MSCGGSHDATPHHQNIKVIIAGAETPGQCYLGLSAVQKLDQCLGLFVRVSQHYYWWFTPHHCHSLISDSVGGTNTCSPTPQILGKSQNLRSLQLSQRIVAYNTFSFDIEPKFFQEQKKAFSKAFFCFYFRRNKFHLWGPEGLLSNSMIINYHSI